MRKIDDILTHTHGVQSFSGISGFSLLSNASASYTGFYFLQLDPWHEHLTDELSAQGLMRTSTNEWPAEIPEAIGFALARPPFPASALPVDSLSCFRIAVVARSFNSRKCSTSWRWPLKKGGIASIVSTFRPSVPQLYVEVDQDRVLKQGLQFTEVYQTLRASSAAPMSISSNRFGRQWKVYLQAETRI